MKNRLFWILMISGQVVLASEYVKFLTPVEIDFGEVPSGKVVEGKIQFVNTSDENVEIRELQVSCGCTAVEAVKRNYAPGDTATVNFKVNTRGFHGKVQKSITVEFENSNIPVQTVLIQIDCIDYLDCYPNYVTFTQIHVNADTTIEREVLLTNHYRETVTLKPCSWIFPMSK